MKCRILAIVLAALCFGCSTSKSAAPATAEPVKNRPQFGSWGVDLAAMDKTIKAGDDYFMFSNGTWYKAAEIPPDRSSIGSFQDLRILSEKRMVEIAGSLDDKPYDQLSTDEKKLRDLYDAFLDQKEIDSRALLPAQKDLDYLKGLKSLNDVAQAMALPALEAYSIFNVDIEVNDKDSDHYAVQLSQSGLGMPNRDYYLRDDKDLASTRDAYKKYLAGMFTTAGMSDAEARANRVYDVELKIAQAQWPNADRRDAEKTYNPMSVSQLKKFAPQFAWDAFLAAVQIPITSPVGERQVVVAEKSAFPKLAAVFAATPVSTWSDYLIAHYLHTYAAYLPKNIDDADFAFYGTVLQGNAQQLPRNTRAAHLLDGAMGESLGKLYVAKYFPPEAKAKAQELVANLLKAYEMDIQTLDWMTPPTREKALEKLHHFGVKIGYPDNWRDYSAYVVKRDDLIGDIQRNAEFNWNRRLKRLDDRVDRTEWGMTPPTVNAYNNFEFNEIVFPAAILQPPFFDPYADDAVNYGGIGAVIGHEISHGFDDQGSKFGPTGSLSNWWTKEDRKNFESRTAMLGKQYDSYEPLPGLHINGGFTMGENIADLAGLAISFKAYQIAVGGKPAPLLDGYTLEQRFYLAFGQIWRAKQRDGALRQQILSNEHSPSMFRAIGATRNQDSWYSAFNVQAGDKYYLPPDQRVHLW